MTILRNVTKKFQWMWNRILMKVKFRGMGMQRAKRILISHKLHSLKHFRHPFRQFFLQWRPEQVWQDCSLQWQLCCLPFSRQRGMIQLYLIIFKYTLLVNYLFTFILKETSHNWSHVVLQWDSPIKQQLYSVVHLSWTEILFLLFFLQQWLLVTDCSIWWLFHETICTVRRCLFVPFIFLKQ